MYDILGSFYRINDCWNCEDLMVNFKFEKGKKAITFLSVGLSIITVLFLSIAREAYAVVVAFLLLLIKGGYFINELWPVDKELSHTNSSLTE